MAWWYPLAAAAGSAIIGKMTEPSLKSGSEGIYRDIARDVDKVKPPTVEEQYVQVESLVQQGLITPLEAEEILADPSLMAEITTDPFIAQAQQESLAKLQEIGEEGLTLEDKARLEQVRREVGAQEKGQRERLAQEMEERGVRGSGIELAAQLQLQQSAADRRSQEALEQEARAEQRALEAIMQSGQVAGQMRGQQFGEQSAKAQAEDAIRQFNVANQRQVQEANIQRQMQSQVSNLAEKQRLADANTARRQEEELRRAQLKQQRFQNLMQKEETKAAAMGGVAKSREGEAKRRGALYGGLIGAAGQIGAQYIKKS
jgi:hypothetical protein